jgi:hypothetical protein
MKKVLATILAIIYLSTSMGATLHFHYCMGKLIGWGLIDHDSKNCSVCGMQKADPPAHRFGSNKGCCSDQDQLIKNTTDQWISLSVFQFTKVVAECPIDRYDLSVKTWHSSSLIDFPTANAPPGLAGNPVYLLHCNFRI